MGKFEDHWKGVFDRAEALPSDAVWSNIDRDLEGADMKKRVVFYQRIAAGAVFFALLVGGYEIYRWRNVERIAQQVNSEKGIQETPNTIQQPQNNLDEKIVTKKNISAEESKNVSVATSENNSQNKNNEASVSLNKNPIAKLNQKSNDAGLDKKVLISYEEEKNKTDLTISANENNSESLTYFDHDKKFRSSIDEIPALSLLPGATVKGKPVVVELVRKLPAIPAAFMADTKKDKSQKENVWASLTAASGNYNPNTSMTNANRNGSSYSMAMLAGARIASRWTLQSGIQYLNQSINTSSYVSSSYALSAVAGSLYSPSSTVNNSAVPVNVVSANELVSVPVQAGYLLINRKFGWQINSGVSSDFFIRNTLSDPSGQRQSFSQSAGQDSPYRSVNFSGLMSSEVSYKVSKHYRISVVPGFRYSFNPILKSSVNTASGNPWVWDVGFRFKYIFK